MSYWHWFKGCYQQFKQRCAGCRPELCSIKSCDKLKHNKCYYYIRDSKQKSNKHNQLLKRDKFKNYRGRIKMNRGQVFGEFIMGVFFIFVIIVSALTLDYYSILWEGVTAPKREAVRRKTWEQTKSHREGKRQELIKYRFQWLKTQTDNEKAIIESTVRMMFADVDLTDANPELVSFKNKCMGVK